MKDNFSKDAEKYAQFRPTYPVGLFQYLSFILPNTKTAWDCGTGNGQIALQLTDFIREIHATDISQNQLDNARKHPRIAYSKQSAEQTDFPDQYFDLITVGQAIHWFDFEKFYPEAKRVLKKDGLLAIIGYGFLSVSPLVDDIITRFYKETIGPYWDPERRYIEEGYQTIPFPFQELKVPTFQIQMDWTFQQLIGYLKTWSAVKHFQYQNGYNPVDEIEEPLKACWTEEVQPVYFPVLFRLGSK